MVAEALKQFGGVLDSGHAFRIDRLAADGAGGETDAQAAGCHAHIIGPDAFMVGGEIGIAGFRPCGNVEGDRRVAHGAADDEIGCEAGHGITDDRALRDAGAAGLEADKAGRGGGNADRPAAIIGMGERHDACRDRRRRAAGGAAGRMIRVPRIAGGSIEIAFGHRQKAELGHVGLAEGHEAGREEALG